MSFKRGLSKLKLLRFRILLGVGVGTAATLYVIPTNQRFQVQMSGPISTTTFASSSSSLNSTKTFRAICILNPDNDSGVSGVVEFIQNSGQLTTIRARVTGLTDGKHGFHIHEFGNLTQGCTTAGAHYNPLGFSHGGPQHQQRHMGDLGNIESKNGVAVIEFKDPLIQLSGAYTVIGRSVVVHKDEDDLGQGNFPDSKTTGHAGNRVACGIIGINS